MQVVSLRKTKLEVAFFFLHRFIPLYRSKVVYSGNCVIQIVVKILVIVHVRRMANFSRGFLATQGPVIEDILGIVGISLVGHEVVERVEEITARAGPAVGEIRGVESGLVGLPGRLARIGVAIACLTRIQWRTRWHR